MWAGIELTFDVVRTLNFAYDAASQLTSTSDNDTAYSFTYDNLGRVKTVSNSGTTGVPTVVITNWFDAFHRRTQASATINGTADYKTTFTYDALDRTTKIQQTGQTGGNTVGTKRVDLYYNAAGQRWYVNRYADTAGTQQVGASTSTFDQLGRLTALDHKKGSTNLANYTWTYDAHSRITGTTNKDGSSSYTYDTTDQLTRADHTYQTTETYTYDANGNRTSGGHTIGTNNRLTTDGTYDYTYDAEGNRTRKTKISDGSYVDYTWDHRNRLTAVAFKTSAGILTKQVTYGYDTFDRRVKKSVDDDGNGTIDRTERYVYDFTNKTDGTTDVSLDDVVLTFDGSGNLTHRYLHGADIDELFADETATGAVLWALDDEQGTIRDWAEYNAGTNTTTVTDHLKYDSYGRITSQSNSSHTVVYAFTGREWDKDVDLQYNRMRWYDPVVGRWISEDPIGFAGGDANLVRYVGNNPVNWEDPSGLAGWGKLSNGKGNGFGGDLPRQNGPQTRTGADRGQSRRGVSVGVNGLRGPGEDPNYQGGDTTGISQVDTDAGTIGNFIRDYVGDDRLLAGDGLGDDLLISAKVATDITGQFDPTPTSDLINGAIDIAEGNWEDGLVTIGGALIPGGPNPGKLGKQVAGGAVDTVVKKGDDVWDGVRRRGDNLGGNGKNLDCGTMNPRRPNDGGGGCFVAGTPVVVEAVTTSAANELLAFEPAKDTESDAKERWTTFILMVGFAGVYLLQPAATHRTDMRRSRRGLRKMNAVTFEHDEIAV